MKIIVLFTLLFNLSIAEAGRTRIEKCRYRLVGTTQGNNPVKQYMGSFDVSGKATAKTKKTAKKRAKRYAKNLVKKCVDNIKSGKFFECRPKRWAKKSGGNEAVITRYRLEAPLNDFKQKFCTRARTSERGRRGVRVIINAEKFAGPSGCGKIVGSGNFDYDCD